MSAQEMLWAFPTYCGPYWNMGLALCAAPTCFVLFWYLVFKQPFSALLIARLGWLGTLVCVAFSPLNSGWMPWATCFLVFSSMLWSILLVTGWCEREDQHDTMGGALWRYFCRGLNRLFGPYKEYSPDDTWRKF